MIVTVEAAAVAALAVAVKERERETDNICHVQIRLNYIQSVGCRAQRRLPSWRAESLLGEAAAAAAVISITLWKH